MQFVFTKARTSLHLDDELLKTAIPKMMQRALRVICSRQVFQPFAPHNVAMWVGNSRNIRRLRHKFVPMMRGVYDVAAETLKHSSAIIINLAVATVHNWSK